MKADDDVLARIVKEGTVRWNTARYALRAKVLKAPVASLRRLTTLGYIEVESHNISVWKFGPRDSYKSGYGSTAWANQVTANIALLDQMDDPVLKSRTEVWAIPTARGIEFARRMGLLESE